MDVHGEPTPPSRMSGFEIPNLSAVNPQITVSSQPPPKKNQNQIREVANEAQCGPGILDTRY